MIVLVGHEGSRQVRKISEYLTNKYLPKYMKVRYIENDRPVNEWSAFVADYLKTLPDREVILSLDDFLIRNRMNSREFTTAWSMVKKGCCVKLCPTAEQEHIEYPVTCQYTLWNREDLIALLEQTTSPWDFETNGSKLYKGESLVHTCLDYDNHSALSSRWKGIKLDGIKEEDINYIKTHGFI